MADDGYRDLMELDELRDKVVGAALQLSAARITYDDSHGEASWDLEYREDTLRDAMRAWAKKYDEITLAR